MKRSWLKRNKPLARGTAQLKRSGFARPAAYPTQTPPKPRAKRLRGTQSKPNSVFRSPAYLAAVRRLSCVCCGAAGITEAAHSNQLRWGKGRSIKASDATAMALCRTIPGVPGCHAIHDQGGARTKQAAWAFEYEHIVLTVHALIEAGSLTGDADLLTQVLNTGYGDHETAAVYFVELIESGKLRVRS